MKSKRYKLGLVFALALTSGFFAPAQSNNIAAPTDYAAFSRLITERNIFDPNRYPHNVHDYHPRTTIHQTRAQRAAPAFTLVGTMSYEKGMFAFFDGNNADLRKVLPASGNIAGFTVTDVTLAGVELQSADKKETVPMKLGDIMRQEGDHWMPAGNGNLDRSSTIESGSGTSSETPAANPGSTSEAPAAAGPANDVLKRLMQQREQELK